jgi:DNA-binding XRE family transcriptional regulator
MKYRVKETRTPLKLANQLRAGRALAGLTQGEFAKLVGVTERSIARWEAKTGQPCSTPTDQWAVDALAKAGIEVFDKPTLGVRLAEAAHVVAVVPQMAPPSEIGL